MNKLYTNALPLITKDIILKVLNSFKVELLKKGADVIIEEITSDFLEESVYSYFTFNVSLTFTSYLSLPNSLVTYIRDFLWGPPLFKGAEDTGVKSLQKECSEQLTQELGKYDILKVTDDKISRIFFDWANINAQWDIEFSDGIAYIVFYIRYVNRPDSKLIRYFRNGCVKEIENEVTDNVKHLVNKLDCYKTKSNIVDSIDEDDFEVLVDDVQLTRDLLEEHLYTYRDEVLSNPFFEPDESLFYCVDILCVKLKNSVNEYLKKHDKEDFKKEDLIKFIQNVEIL